MSEILQDFSCVEDEYKTLITKRIDSHYPFIVHFFGQEGVNEVLALEMENALNMYEDIVDETEFRLKKNRHIQQLLLSGKLADYNDGLEKLFEECASRKMAPSHDEYTYNDLKKKVDASELTAIELFLILKNRKIEDHFAEHGNRVMQCPFKGVVKKLQESIITSFGIMKPRS